MYIYFIAQSSDSCSMTSAVHAMLMCSFLYHKDDEVVDELHYEIKKIEGRQPAWEDDADDEERYLNLLPMNCVAPLLLNTDMPASNQDMILTVIITNIIIIIIIIIIILMKIIISSGHLLSMTEFLTDHNERFQKISILYHGRLLGFPKRRGGSQLWNSKGMGAGADPGFQKGGWMADHIY